MRIKKIAIILSILLLSAFSFTACTKKREATPLAAPVVSASGTRVSWDEIENATGYEVFVNEVSKTVTTLRSYTLTEATGDYNVNVKAKGDGVDYSDSPLSNTVVVTVSDGGGQTLTEVITPVISLDSATNIITWTVDPNADLYEIYINGVKKSQTIKGTYTFTELSAGVYEIKVKGVGDEVNFASSQFSNVITIIKQEVLASPSITLIENTIYWASIAYADKYEIYANSTKIGEIDDAEMNEFTFIPTQAGSFDLRVKALSNNQNYETSDFSNSRTFEVTKFSPPVVENDNRDITWAAIPNAVKYEVYVDNVKVDEVTGTYFRFIPSQIKTYVIKVKAIGNGTSYLSSDLSSGTSVVVTTLVLETPVLTTVGETVKWDKIAGASHYEIYKNDVLVSDADIVAEDNVCSYTLIGGGPVGTEITIGVKAIADLSLNPLMNDSIKVEEKVTLKKWLEIYYNGTNPNMQFFTFENVGSAEGTVSNNFAVLGDDDSRWFQFTDIEHPDGFTRYLKIELHPTSTGGQYLITTGDWDKDGGGAVVEITNPDGNRIANIPASLYTTNNIAQLYVISGSGDLSYTNLSDAVRARYSISVNAYTLYSNQSTQLSFNVKGCSSGRIYFTFSSTTVTAQQVIDKNMFIEFSGISAAGGTVTANYNFGNISGNQRLRAVLVDTNRDPVIETAVASGSTQAVVATTLIINSVNFLSVVAKDHESLFTVNTGRKGVMYYLVTDSATAPSAEDLRANTSGNGVTISVGYGVSAQLTMAAYTGSATTIYMHAVLVDEQSDVSPVKTVSITVGTYSPEITTLAASSGMMIPNRENNLDITVNASGKVYYIVGTSAVPSASEIISGGTACNVTLGGNTLKITPAYASANNKVHFVFVDDQSGQSAVKSTTITWPYVITNAATLKSVLANADAVAGTIVLLNDIDFTGNTWEAPTSILTGTFDGCGFTISNLSFGEKTENTGLFASLGNNAVIRNINFVNVTATWSDTSDGDVPKKSIGVLAADMLSNATILIQNVAVDFSVRRIAGESVGGLIGVFTGTGTSLTIENCHINFTLINAGAVEFYCGGGIIGKYEDKATTTNSLTVSNCYIKVTANGENGRLGHTGAISGAFRCPTTVTNSYFELVTSGSLSGNLNIDYGYIASSPTPSHSNVLGVNADTYTLKITGTNVTAADSVTEQMATNFVAAAGSGNIWSYSENTLKHTVNGTAYTVATIA